MLSIPQKLLAASRNTWLASVTIEFIAAAANAPAAWQLW